MYSVEGCVVYSIELKNLEVELLKGLKFKSW